MKAIQRLFSLIVILAVLFPFSCYAKEEIKETILGMNVSGNKEAPNILYIIPWKSHMDIETPPEVTRLMDEIYSTVDPDVYQKEIMFFDQLTENNSLTNKVKNK